MTKITIENHSLSEARTEGFLKFCNEFFSTDFQVNIHSGKINFEDN